MTEKSATVAGNKPAAKQNKKVEQKYPQCHMCQCPLFTPVLTCQFCNRNACSDHLRKFRQPKIQSPNVKNRITKYDPNICDDCEDIAMFEAVMADSEVFADIQEQQEDETNMQRQQLEIRTKHDEILTRLQAKEIKYGKVSIQHQQNYQLIMGKMEELKMKETNLPEEWRQLDQHEELINQATIQIEQMEREPYKSLQDDVKLLQSSQNGKLTKELLRLQKLLDEMKQSMKKIQAEMEKAYEDWEKKQIQKKNSKKGDQKECCTF